MTFPYPVFGRFAYILSALVGLTFLGGGRLRLLGFFGVSPPISDRLYANSRTPDIGKAKGPISPQPVGTVWGREVIVFPGGCICGTALVTGWRFFLIPAVGLKGRALL